MRSVYFLHPPLEGNYVLEKYSRFLKQSNWWQEAPCSRLKVGMQSQELPRHRSILWQLLC